MEPPFCSYQLSAFRDYGDMKKILLHLTFNCKLFLRMDYNSFAMPKTKS